jgi:hypothetical protein
MNDLNASIKKKTKPNWIIFTSEMMTIDQINWITEMLLLFHLYQDHNVI